MIATRPTFHACGYLNRPAQAPRETWPWVVAYSAAGPYAPRDTWQTFAEVRAEASRKGGPWPRFETWPWRRAVAELRTVRAEARKAREVSP